MSDVLIDTYRPGDQPAFAALNHVWLVAYGLLEEPDQRQMDDPMGEIVEPGGQIFLARRQGRVVGTCAVVPHGESVFELVKLTVAPEAQGLGLGRRLVEACLGYAREQGAERVVLLSNTQLGAAVRLYEGLGFRHAPLPPDRPYLTADVYMEFEFKPQPTA